MLKRFFIWIRFLLLVALAATQLGTAPGYADQPDADLVKQGTAALKHHDYDVAIARFSDAIRLAPEDAVAWGKRAEAYAAKGENERARSDCTRAITLAPQSAASYGECGYVYLLSNELERAIDAYSTAIKLDPRHASLYSARGLSFSEIGQTDRAISDYDTAIQLDPSQSDVYVYRGNAWFMKGKFDRAWADYNHALDLNPKNAYAYVCRGYAASQLYAYDDAIADFNKAISINPIYKDAYRYREVALQRKSDSRWGLSYLFLMGVGLLALLFSALWTYISPTAFRHITDRHFKRMTDGRSVFYPKIKGIGYVVPDAQVEQTLRAYVRRTKAVSLVFGIVMIGLAFVLLPAVSPLNAWLSAVTGLSMWTTITITSGAEVIVIMCGFFFGFSMWRRAATRGLTEAVEPGEPLPPDQWNNDFVLDMPVAVRWIVVPLIAFVFFQSLKGLWQTGHGLSLARIERMSLFDWLLVGSYLLALWYCGKLLVYAARQRGRRADHAEKPT
jgi:tetratricopeptide (TPR) repeat protein